MKYQYPTHLSEHLIVKEALTFFNINVAGTQSSPLSPIETELLRWAPRPFQGSERESIQQNRHQSLEEIKRQIVSAYQPVLSNIQGIYRALVKFSKPDDPAHGTLNCDLYFLVNQKLYFNIDTLYEPTDDIRDYFEQSDNVNIFYHYAIYHGQDLEENIIEDAWEIYLESGELSTASQF